MQWFFIALIGPLMYALTNHIDKILLEKYFKNGGIGTILLFNSLFKTSSNNSPLSTLPPGHSNAPKNSGSLALCNKKLFL